MTLWLFVAAMAGFGGCAAGWWNTHCELARVRRAKAIELTDKISRETDRHHVTRMQLDLADRRCAELEQRARTAGQDAGLVALADEVTRRYFGVNAERGRQIIRQALTERDTL